MLKLISIIGFSLLVFACNDLDSKRNKILALSKDELVKEIAKANIVAGGAVGYAAVEPDQWVRYIALKTKTNEQDLIDLTNHSNKTVKCYAFTALIEKKGKVIFDLLLKNITDTGKVTTFYGCIMESLTVGEFYMQNALAGEHINKIQKQILDSVVLFNGDSNLISGLNILENIPPTPTYYNLIRERASQHPEYIAALAKYRNPSDRKTISDLLKNSDRSTQYWGIRAVINFPDRSFFQTLSEIAKTNYNTTVQSEEEYLNVLYKALVQYRNQASKNILKEAIHKATGMDSIKKIDLVYGALKKYPDSIYKNLIQYF
jgi:hypothetical protein